MQEPLGQAFRGYVPAPALSCSGLGFLTCKMGLISSACPTGLLKLTCSMGGTKG